MKKERLWMMLLMAAVLMLTAACSKDDDDEQPVKPPSAAGARLQVMMVFAPGQLGDDGYADGALMGASAMELPEALVDQTDTIDVQFISLYSVSDTRQALKDWAATAVHPFYDAAYERRLLVLTEPYQTAWLADVKRHLRETDEVLVMKADEAYTQKVAETYGLGSRVHGLNYDMSEAIRLYCDNVRVTIQDRALDGFPIEKPEIVLFRRFNAQQNYYCDGMEDIIRQELGNDVTLTVKALSDYVSHDDANEETNMAYIQAAYEAAAQFDLYFEDAGYGFVIADLGTSNSGMLNYLLGAPLCNYEVLMIDNDPVNYDHAVICRDGFYACYNWIYEWMNQPAGSMPRFRLYDSSTVYHNLSTVDDVER